jgi:2-polyprenyl-3-methyl-5-hydroxy-6-metoxy-1,4-benzoquinol methylase
MSNISKTFYESVEKENISCPICDYSKHKKIYDNDRYDMGVQTVICEKCSLIYINPRPTELAMASFYKNHYRNFYESIDVPTETYITNGPFLPRAKFVYQLLKPFLPNANNLLDVGCAEGTLLKLIEQNNPTIETYGIEPSDGFGNFAKNQLNGAVFIGGYQEFVIQNKNHKYDIITSTHVLEHILQPKEFITSLKSMMHEKSVLYIEVPNITNNNLTGIGSIHLGHVSSFDPVTLKLLLNLCGLEIINFYTEGLPALTPAMGVICKVSEKYKSITFSTSSEVEKKAALFTKRILLRSESTKSSFKKKLKVLLNKFRG